MVLTGERALGLGLRDAKTGSSCCRFVLLDAALQEIVAGSTGLGERRVPIIARTHPVSCSPLVLFEQCQQNVHRMDY